MSIMLRGSASKWVPYSFPCLPEFWSFLGYFSCDLWQEVGGGMRCGCGGQQRFGIAIVAKGDGRVTLGFIVVSGQS